MIAIHINSSEEWEATKELLGPVQIKYFPYGEFFESSVDDFDCIYYNSGATKTLSSGACQYAIDKWKPEIVFVFGTCGGVSKDVNTLDIILAEKTSQYDVIPMRGKENIFHEIIEFDNSWINLDKFPHKLEKGFLATADKSVTAKNYHSLRKGGVKAADWETASIATICKINKVKCCVLRGVSDGVSQEDVFLQFEDYKVNTDIIMKKLIILYFPALIAQYKNWKTN